MWRTQEYPQECKRCKYKWTSRVENPKECPNCKSRHWDKGEKKEHQAREKP